MLENARHWQQLSSKLSVDIKAISKRLSKLTISLLPLTLLTMPATAAESVLGIVKSPENAAQWSEITNRLQRVGVNYCIVEASEWQQELDLGNINVLLFPNVATLNGAQTQTLQRWMNKGGKAIMIPILYEVASPTLDAAWLQAALKRYGISTYGKLAPVANNSPAACRTGAGTGPNDELKPFLPNLQTPLEQSQSLLNQSMGFHSEPSLSEAEVQSMTQELQGLIGRFETTLLTADAHHSNTDVSTSQVVKQLLSKQTKSYKQLIQQAFNPDNQDAHQALKEARDGLNKFLSLVDQRSYMEAKTQWLTAKNVLWDNYPTARQIAQPEVRAMWLDRGTIVKAKSEADLAKIFDSMATAGINTVFFETVNAGYTIYPSQIAPEQNPLVTGWDPLKAAVKLAHERGMELHAWVWTFAATNQRHNVILNQPPNYLGPVLSRHPDWAITDREGNYFDYNSEKVFFDPANPDVKRYLSLLLEEIATDYEVDGIHLDYVRYPFQSPAGDITYGYSGAARAQFKQMTGVDPIQLNPNHPLWSQWTKFRIDQVDSFIGSVSQNLKQLRPDLILSTAVFPIPRRERLSKIQQHWEEWISQEWIDMLVPMTYSEDTEQLQTLASPLLSEFEQGKALLLPGIRLLNISDVAAVDQIQLLRGMSTEGYALFAAENLNSNLETIFNRTQGKVAAESKQPLPYREPFQATLSRYQSLQKEWNFFLSNNQLSVEDIILEEWGQEADKLAGDLQQLVDEPSTKHFLLTQIALTSLRRKFPQWVKETKSIESYQAQVWENRLDALERLLSYGEKRILNKDLK